MQTKEYTTIDRSALNWGSGPWDDEPDKIQWADAKTGLPCLAVRNRTFGNWCGYVGVAEGHPLFGLDYDAVYNRDDCDHISVHGGLTYSDLCQPHDSEAVGICHVPDEGEPHKVWWFGFDCAHVDDLSPGLFQHESDVYRNLAYVKAQCAALASQLVTVRKAA